MGNSLMVGCAKLGMHFVACAPEKYFPAPELIAQCQEIAAQTGALLDFDTDPINAVKGAQVLYTDAESIILKVRLRVTHAELITHLITEMFTFL